MQPCLPRLNAMEAAYSSSALGKPVDRDAQPERVLTLPPHLGREHVQASPAHRFLPPLGFEHVAVGIEAERTVRLPAFQRACRPRIKIEEPE